MKRWLCRHGWHRWKSFGVPDLWCVWGRHWENEGSRVFCNECMGPYPADKWPGSQYGGHWDTCPNRVQTKSVKGGKNER